MARRMADKTFREEQWLHRYAPHIALINYLVDELRNDSARGWAPYVAPLYGGTEARLLSVLRDPGPKTQDGKGSGFLCMENDDATAETMSTLFEGVGIGPDKIVPWNVYPWYINRAPKADELNAGVEPLKRLLDLLPRVEVIMLHGNSAHNGWRRLTRRYPALVAERKLRVIETYHTSRQAFWHSDPAERQARRDHLHTSFQEAAHSLER